MTFPDQGDYDKIVRALVRLACAKNSIVPAEKTLLQKANCAEECRNREQGSESALASQSFQ